MAEDRRLEPQQLGAGLEPELLDEALPGAVEGPEGLDLPPRAVEAEHQLRGEPLVHRVVVDRPVELGDHVVVPAELDLRVEAHLHGDEAQLVEVHGRRPAPLGVGHVGVGRTAPEGERPLGGVPGEGRVGGQRVAGPAGEQLERGGVHRAGGHVEHVAGAVPPEQIGVAECSAQQGEVAVEGADRGAGGVVAPDVLDEPFGGDELAVGVHEPGQHGPLARAPDRRDVAVTLHPRRTEHAHDEPDAFAGRARPSDVEQVRHPRLLPS